MIANKISEKKVNEQQVVIVEAMMTWAKEFSAVSEKNIVALYAQDASLWGTFSSLIRTKPDSISDYFEKIFVFEHRKVNFNDYNIRIYGNTAISSGLYTFSLFKAGQKLVIPARYSFTYVNFQGRWLIVEHHSSVMPEDL